MDFEKSRVRKHCESQFFSNEEISQVFVEIDKEKDGFLSRSEVRAALVELNLQLSDKELEQLFEHLSNGEKDNHLITLDQFSTFVGERQKRLAEVFCELDTTNDGVLESNEITIALEKLGMSLSSEDVKLLIQSLDSNNDGKIEFSEFRRLFLLCHEVDVENVFEAWRQCIDLAFDKGEDSYTIPRENLAWKIIVAGAVAGAISRTATAPLDRLKILLQAGTLINGKPIHGVISGLQSIYRTEGTIAFFRGNGTNVLKIAPESAIKFFAYERFKTFVSPDPENLNGFQRFIAGAMAGVTAQTLIYPLEITKTRLAVSPAGTYSGIADCLYKIYTKEGSRSLFRGLGASIGGIIPYAGVDLSVFFTLKAAWKAKHPQETPGVILLLSMGATSSFLGQITAYPLQLVRTKLQAQGLPGSTSYDGMGDCIKNVYRTKGILGFYKGITPNFMKAIPAISISYVVYEKVREVLKPL